MSRRFGHCTPSNGLLEAGLAYIHALGVPLQSLGQLSALPSVLPVLLVLPCSSLEMQKKPPTEFSLAFPPPFV
eukprot:CAMPEP_0172749514 /NCGR_PEP_ID=MMETSP1074-20121228/147567_1 /TAXON_ID=2916 /ORGANISM="Ceratium fusus, Strain PA161109" /LENGTH=72 /DNA_ID=CAMNT_0013581501 /DNA_START=117 /DNA_END=335 /DNA_ORIENTATION=+